MTSGKLRILLCLFLGVFVIASFEVAQVPAAGGGERVTVAKKKCKKGYKRVGKKCKKKKRSNEKKRSGVWTGDRNVSLFKIVENPNSAELFATQAVAFEASSGCGPTGYVAAAIGTSGGTEPIFGASSSGSGGGLYGNTSNNSGFYGTGNNYIGGSTADFYTAEVDGKIVWGGPNTANTAEGFFRVVHTISHNPVCDSGQVQFKVHEEWAT